MRKTLFQIILVLEICSLFGSCFYKKPANENECMQGINCKLPTCNCDSDSIPINITGKYRIDQLPQLVVIAIDDEELDYKSYILYKSLVEDFRNPNGLQPRLTLFLSDTYNRTSYCLVRNLYENGHEIAISTLHNECPHKLCNSDDPWDFEKWTQEILEMRHRLELYAAVPRMHISGFRAPIMQTAADFHYRIISAQRFLYDSSLIIKNENIIWPFTLDFNIRNILMNIGPSQSYQNLWELPANVYFGTDGNDCMNLWQCRFDRTVYGTSKFLRANLLRAYYANRAPFTINVLSKWLKEESFVDKPIGTNTDGRQVFHKQKVLKNFEALKVFINETLEKHDDVYFVTAKEAIEWVRHLDFIGNSVDRINLTQYLNESVINFDLIDLRGPNGLYDGKCAYLHQKQSDYNVSNADGLEHLIGNRMAYKITQQAFRSESLFINHVFTYMLFFLLIVYIGIVIYDKTSA